MVGKLGANSANRLHLRTHATSANWSIAEKPSRNPCGNIGTQLLKKLGANSANRLHLRTHAISANWRIPERPSQNRCGNIDSMKLEELCATTAAGLAALQSIAKHVRRAATKHAQRPQKGVIVRMPSSHSIMNDYQRLCQKFMSSFVRNAYTSHAFARTHKASCVARKCRKKRRLNFPLLQKTNTYAGCVKV